MALAHEAGADVPLIRDLLTQVLAWPRATQEARRLASVMWHETADPDRADPALMGRTMARLTGELRRARYAADPGIAPAVDALRARVAALEGSQPLRESGHGVFAARTRSAAHAAGLDL